MTQHTIERNNPTCCINCDMIPKYDKNEDDIIQKMTKELEWEKQKRTVNTFLEERRRKISHSRAESKQQFYYVQLGNNGREKITSTTEKGLYLKLYSYIINLQNSQEIQFKDLFSKALSEKERQTNATNNVSSHNTIAKINSDYKRFITEEFERQDVRKITAPILRNYILSVLENYYQTNHKKLKLKAYRGFITVLSMSFKYAAEQEICSYNIVSDATTSPKLFSAYIDSSKKADDNDCFSENDINRITEEINKRIFEYYKEGQCYTCGFIFLIAVWSYVKI